MTADGAIVRIHDTCCPLVLPYLRHGAGRGRPPVRPQQALNANRDGGQAARAAEAGKDGRGRDSGGSGAARSAAAVAAMVGETLGTVGRDEIHVKSVLGRSRDTFKALPIASMHEMDIDGSNKDLAAKKTEEAEVQPLAKRVKRVKLGYCDAFLSHSWRDGDTPEGRVAKWKALQAWRARFREEEGRDPTLWLE